MKQRPILFSTPMVQAILEGRKTQIRRVTKMQPGEGEGYEDLGNGEFAYISNGGMSVPYTCPYGQVGDILWIRESFSKVEFKDKPILYLFKANPDHQSMKWKPSIHMPKVAARIWLRITNVRVERLQDISEEDAKAEGIDELFDSSVEERWKNYGLEPYNKPLNNPASSFMTLWWRINGMDNWDANPWVWVIEFERIEKP